MLKIAIYPGSFDPVTYGHLDVIKRASQIFDQVIVAVAKMTTQKKTLFTAEERIAMLQEVTKGLPAIKIENFDGLVVEYARKKGAKVIIRGLRMFSDFEFEFQMALTNRRLAENIETVFLMPSEGYSFLSSTLIKEVAALGGEITTFVPDVVAKRLKEKQTSIEAGKHRSKK